MFEPAPNHYDVLGVKSTASPDEIRRRYKFMVIAFHPDRFLRTPEHHAMAEGRLKQINEAYRVLADPQARAQYDLARLLAVGGAAAGMAVQPFVGHLQHEAAQAQARAAQLEQELAAWRGRCAAAEAEKSALLQEQAGRERSHQQERQALEEEIARLTGQLEQTVRQQAAFDGQLQEQQTKANKKAARLAQELANQERLVENLAATKAEWERSNQSHYDLLQQQVQKLREELKRREGMLAQQRQVQRSLEERLATADHEARLAAQATGAALRAKQQEVDTLLAESRQVDAVQGREQKSVRLWQIAALIAILNTLLLLGLLLAP